MTDLCLYRMPDEPAYSSWILSLNGVALSQVTIELDTSHELPFANVPREILGLAVRLERALQVKIQYHDRRLRPSSVRLHVVRS